MKQKIGVRVAEVPGPFTRETMLQAAFDGIAVEENTDAISTRGLFSLWTKLGRSESDLQGLLRTQPGKNSFTFADFISIYDTPADKESDAINKVEDFLNVLREYRDKCVAEGNYLEAAKTEEQLKSLTRQEEKRRRKSKKAKELADLQQLQQNHEKQYREFTTSWETYLEEYDEMSRKYIRRIQEKHAEELRKFQEDVREELLDRAPRFSKELLEWRRRQHIFARQKNYAEAQKIRRIADVMEEKEKKAISKENSQIMQRREDALRQQQQAELQALLKRIDGRRKEHIKQRNIDMKRLLQRNKNIQNNFESQQALKGKKELVFARKKNSKR